MGHSESCPGREIHSITNLSPEARKISKKQSYATPKGTRKRTTKKPKVSRKKEIIKIRAEINDRETKENNTKDL